MSNLPAEKEHARRVRRQIETGDRARRRLEHFGAIWFGRFTAEPPEAIVEAFRKEMPRSYFAALAAAFARAAVDDIPTTCGD